MPVITFLILFKPHCKFSQATVLKDGNSVLKNEEIYLHTCQDFKEAGRALFEYIESWDNRKRIYSKQILITFPQ